MRYIAVSRMVNNQPALNQARVFYVYLLSLRAINLIVKYFRKLIANFLENIALVIIEILSRQIIGDCLNQQAYRSISVFYVKSGENQCA